MKSLLVLALAALGGLVSAETVHGTLVDAQGRPLAGAWLGAYAITHPEGRFAYTLLSSITAKDGGFVLRDAPTKPTVDLPIFLMARLPHGSLAPVRLTRDGGQATWRPVPTSTLTVEAVAPDGRPIAGATARLTNAILSDASVPKDAAVLYQACLPANGPAAVTDKDGIATIVGVPVGATAQYRVLREGRLSVDGSLRLETSGARAKTTLAVGAVVAGRVLRDGKPIPGVDVIATTLVDQTTRETRARTDASGAYRIGDTYPGRVSFSADLGKLADAWVATGPTNVPLRPGEERDGLNLTLDPGVLLQGRVLTVGGKPVANAQVWASGPDEGRVDRMTDAQGRFAFRGAPGDWYVALDEVGGRRLNAQANFRATVDAAHNPPLELRIPDAALLPPIAHLTGIVKDADGKPVVGATVKSLLGRGATTTTDASGHFRFENANDPGSVLLASKGDAMSTRTTTILEKSDVTLVLDGKPASLQGILTDDDGKPLAGVTLTLGAEFGGGYVYPPDTTTDANGAYRFDGLYGGVDSFFLWAKKLGYGAVTIQRIRTTPGERKTLETQRMALADGTIDGTVVDERGKPAPGVTVSSQVADVHEAMTDAQGRFHLTGVPRGKHALVARRMNVSAAGAEGTTGQTDVVIALKPESKPIPGLVTGSLTGHVAPAIRVAEWTNGDPLNLGSLKGKIVVVDLWAVWCGPCVASLPDVQRLSETYRSKGVIVVGIHAPGTPRAKVAAFVKSKGLTYPVALDIAESSGAGVTAKAFGYAGIPHLLVIDAKGQVVADTSEVVDAERAVRKLLGEG